MSCPPGTILNPRTYRCVRATGKLAQALARVGNVGEAEVAAAAVYAPPPRTRVTRRYRPNAGVSAAFGAYAPVANKHVAPQPPVNITRRSRPAVACPPGSVINPSTGRCIKVGGRVFRDLFPPAPPEVPRIDVAPRRATSEEPIALPAGNTAVAPLGTRSAALAWIAGNCRNRTDPLTGRSFSTADDAYLSTVVRLHNNTCTAAPALHDKVAVNHKAGKIATLPDSTDPLTLPDFKVLRDAMRRTNPGYKLPPRRHQPPPSEWQLYVASDERSGPEFASVAYVDITKARRTIYGIEYPPEAIRVELGFIPVETPAGAMCSAGMVVDLLERLDKEHRLVVPVAGGWKPAHGFPFTKAHWSKERAARFSRLCKDLARALTLPI